ncbi:MAG: hypothetical protein QM817_37115 [Archangium sp.]
MALLLSACGPGDMMSMLPGTGGFRKIAMPQGQDDANVTGVFCTAIGKCVMTTHSNTGDPGAVFALSDTAVGEKLVDGVYPGPVPTAAAVLGDLDFDGLDKTRNGVVARLAASGAYISATGDITQKSSWTVVPMGREGGDTLPLNAQAALQLDASGKTVLINKRGFVYTSSAAPADSTVWTELWGPTATPSVPADFAAQLALDSRLCDSDVTAGGLPLPSQPAFISQDLAVMVTVAGGLNQDGNAPPGVCISTDQGAHFYSVPFAGTPMSATSPGPLGVTCIDNDKCWAYNGLQFQEGTAYIYFSTNASQGKNSTWTRATLPAAFSASDDISLSGIFFAPDATHGWAVGNNSHKALLLRTTDGGKNWTDVSASVSSVLDNDLYNGFAIDADHIWLSGRFGTLMTTSTAQK